MKRDPSSFFGHFLDGPSIIPCPSGPQCPSPPLGRTPWARRRQPRSSRTRSPHRGWARRPCRAWPRVGFSKGKTRTSGDTWDTSQKNSIRIGCSHGLNDLTHQHVVDFHFCPPNLVDFGEPKTTNLAGYGKVTYCPDPPVCFLWVYHSSTGSVMVSR